MSAAPPSNAADAPLPPNEERRLVKHALPLVYACADDVAQIYPDLVEAKELWSVGTFALHEAVHRYRPAKNPFFEDFARLRVRGAMIDSIRSERFSLRGRVEHRMERAYPRVAELPVLDVDLFHDEDETLLDGMREGLDAVLVAMFVVGAETARQSTAEEELDERREYATAIEALDTAMGALSAEERRVIDLVYFEGKTFVDAARATGVHADTIERRNVRALTKLRRELAARGITRAPPPVDVEPNVDAPGRPRGKPALRLVR